MIVKILFIFVCFCAVSAAPHNIEETKIGGEDVTTLGQIPYAISIEIFTGLHICTGALIHTWWVITTAHCLGNRGPNTILLRPGLVNINMPMSTEDRQGRVLIPHPNFNATTMENDIALVEPSRPFIFNDHIQPIALDSSFTEGAIDVFVVGWGTLGAGQINHNLLRILYTSTLSNDECKARHSELNAALIRDDSLCTNNGVGEGFCNRAIGSPLVRDGRLIAVASWNVPCAIGYPDVYSRISAHIEWIQTVTGGI